MERGRRTELEQAACIATFQIRMLLNVRLKQITMFRIKTYLKLHLKRLV